MKLVREGRGWMFLSGLLLGMGIMLIIWAATPDTREVWPNEDCGPACRQITGEDGIPT